jgi:Domain of unknown function (DUF4167)
MRPQQQNRRMRGRNNNNNNNGNNNRKGPNPLTRNYESNGPDVKIRGSAQQIAEKYSTLARDAMSAGDRVVAENYLQHAEHYNRIIAAAQAQMPIQQVRDNNRDEFDDDLDDDRDEMDNQNANGSSNAETQAPVANGSGPQPVIDGTPAEVALNQDAGSGDGERQRDQRPNGHNNGYNGEDGQRRNRRSRRGGRGRPDFEGGGDSDGQPAQSAEAAESQVAEDRGEGNAEPPARETAAPSEPEITIPNPLPVEPD